MSKKSPNLKIIKHHDKPIANQHGSGQFKPNTTVAAVVMYKDKFLLVEELEHGNTVYNQPAGHLESDESLVSAIKRELKEETGLSLSPMRRSISRAWAPPCHAAAALPSRSWSPQRTAADNPDSACSRRGGQPG